ncbi:hypothetical protein SFUMM280S_01775 [Streptomyces fumanus]
MFEEGVRGPRHGAAITQGVKSPGPGLPEFDERFPWFVAPWGKSPGFTCVIGYDDGRPASSTVAHAITDWQKPQRAPGRTPQPTGARPARLGDPPPAGSTRSWPPPTITTAAWGDVVLFAACTAARIGEVSGCRIADIDTDQWVWTVQRQATPAPGGLTDKGTKGGLTWFADAGVPVHVLRHIAGHGSLVTTQRYLHPDVRSITAAGTALSAHLTAVRAPRSLPSPIVMTR